MERIQNALERARAERATAQGPRAASVPDAAQSPLSPGTSLESSQGPGEDGGVLRIAGDPETTATAWAALRELRLDPVLLERAHVVAAVGGRESAAFDVMRTKLLHQVRAQGWRRIAVTSPGAACGKTTVALNLAFGLARQADVRVALVEADLRRPSFGRILGLKEAEGTVEVLSGAVGPGTTMRRHKANLAVLAATGPRRNPAELLQSPAAGAALDAIEALLDPTVTLFDMPPMMAGDDVMAFAGLMDGVILVAAAGATRIAQIDACERELATRTNVVGVVLNKCRYLDRDEGYGGRY